MEQIQSRQSMRDPFTHRLTVSILALCNLLLALFTLSLLVNDYNTFENEQLAALIFGATAIIATVLLFDAGREMAAHIFPRRKHLAAMVNRVSLALGRMMGYGMPMLRDGEMVVDSQVLQPEVSQPPEPQTPYPDKPELLGFDPYSTIHMLALVLMVFVLGITFAAFALGGGISGQDSSAPTIGVFVFSVIFQFAVLVGGAVFGVGLFFRRDWSATMQRLGLTEFSWADVGIGIVAAIGSLAVAFALLVVWVIIAGQDVVEQQSQASEELIESINTIWLVLLVSITSSVGEEIAFRGALQPIFGLWPTAIFFALVHSQYLFTPATLIIFVPAIVFGYLRRRYNLYTAISAHFAYNFIQLLNAL